MLSGSHVPMHPNPSPLPACSQSTNSSSMRGLALAGIAFAAFIASAFGAVENLTDGSFEDKVSGTLPASTTPSTRFTNRIALAAGGTWFVKFYAPVSVIYGLR